MTMATDDELNDEVLPPRVFVSYSHESEVHSERVLDLANRLRVDGVDARLDRYVESPAEGWIRWMQNEIEAAEFVLVICTATYRRRFDGKEVEGRGLAVNFEGTTIATMIYVNGQRNEKFVPVLLEDMDGSVIPLQLANTTRYQLPDGYVALLRRLTRQPAVVPPPIGQRSHLPLRGTTGSPFGMASSASGTLAPLPSMPVLPGPPAEVPQNLPPRNDFLQRPFPRARRAPPDARG